MKSARVLLLLVVLLVLSVPTPVARAEEETGTIIYLVRHAEKAKPSADDPRDPPLNEAGLKRAKTLAGLMKDAGVTRIFSTDYKRTRQTVEPLAEATGLKIESYDPGNLGDFAAHLKSMQGRFIVSGHSNTTPEMVSALGGDPGAPIEEATEYDRLYMVVVLPGGGVETVLLRY